MHYLDEDLIGKEELEDNLSKHEESIILLYINLIKRQGYKFPYEDPLKFQWSLKKLKAYIEKHKGLILPANKSRKESPYLILYKYSARLYKFKYDG